MAPTIRSHLMKSYDKCIKVCVCVRTSIPCTVHTTRKAPKKKTERKRIRNLFLGYPLTAQTICSKKYDVPFQHLYLVAGSCVFIIHTHGCVRYLLVPFDIVPIFRHGNSHMPVGVQQIEIWMICPSVCAYEEANVRQCATGIRYWIRHNSFECLTKTIIPVLSALHGHQFIGWTMNEWKRIPFA